MKKTAVKERVKFNASNFFTKNIGILGLVVVVLFFVVYLLLQKMNNLENKVIQMEVKNGMESMPVSEPESTSEMMK
jgi:hypothetical protein